ncbi:centrosomal protein of 63 kDa-like isoform X2 [Hypanus sabinus]|uniref:centrosomal protein of 63 kDa-like isoform X2 n=1 Tax=Hypanus sabinus TaxID=79690 RepID=UPI0028C40C65|nr:centrosomal protein of 63 kDa-like isoform X2 [Hypanus sabinus]
MEALLEAVQNLGQEGNILTTCEVELQELMKQIDIMMAYKKSEWESQLQSVETRLKVREQELSAIRLLLDQKQTEVDLLQEQLQDSEKNQHDMVVQYESQLNIFQGEIEKLKKSYQKLQRWHFREVREDMKDRQDRKASLSELNRLNKKVEKSMEENEEQNKKPQGEEDHVIQSKNPQQKQLYKELTKCNELLQSTEQAARLSESLKQQYNNAPPSQTELQEVPLYASLQAEKNLMDEIIVLQHSLDSANQEIFRKQEELKQMKEEYNKCNSDVKKLRDQLDLVEQQHYSELKGMKLEISQLTTELHQRDVAIAEMSVATSNVDRQLQSELEKADRKATEIKLTQMQFKTLKLENQRLAGILKGDEQNCSLMDLRDGYFSSLRQLEQENQQLQKELADVRNKLEVSVKVSQERYEMLLLQIQKKLIDIRETEDRRVEELQLEHEEELQQLQMQLREMTTNAKDYKLPKQSQHPLSKPDCSNLTEGQGQAGEIDHCNVHQWNSCVVSPSDSLHGITSCTLSEDENEVDFPDSVSVQSLCSLHGDQHLPPSLAVESSNTSIAAKFIEAEDIRSQQLLKQLDMHIEELKIESERTVDKYK